MIKEGYLIGGILYLLVALSEVRYYRVNGRNWIKSVTLGLFWPISILVEWFRATSAVLKNDETVNEFLGRLK